MVGVVASLLLAAVFLVAGASKIVAGPRWTADAAAVGAPRRVAIAIPWLELVVGGALASRLAPRAVGVVAAVVLAVFTLALVPAVRAAETAADRPPCACFGAWSRSPVGWRHIARNLALIVVALVVVVAG
jgi:uncharacterized membrane protein YphA (DoxX/SURF4 family)